MCKFTWWIIGKSIIRELIGKTLSDARSVQSFEENKTVIIFFSLWNIIFIYLFILIKEK